MEYLDFINKKKYVPKESGLSKVPELNGKAFDYQKHCIDYLLRIGRGAAFLDTGMGKSIVSLDWGRIIAAETNQPVLMLAPLAVGAQHAREAEKFGIDDVRFIREGDAVKSGINITNYDSLHKFDPSIFGGVILDESSIIKSFTGITTRKLMEAFKDTRFKLACTATPAPNDFMELGQHSQFLDAMESHEMLARFFIADQSGMGRYRLKRHGIKPFWQWVASWARCASRPSDLGFSDDGFELPQLVTKYHEIAADISEDTNGLLFRVPETSATSIHKEKRMTIEQRAEKVAEIRAGFKHEYCVIWCDTDYEADALIKVLPDAIEVRGSMQNAKKEEYLDAFTTGKEKTLITKPEIAGFGLNWQHCNHTIFAGLSFSYERYYQAVRRFYRYGQKKPVNVHVVMSDTERQIWQTVSRKATDHETMKKQMADAMREAINVKHVKEQYVGQQAAKIPAFLKGV